ncbi:MAG: aldehyde ferredoxin oxidoreductase family protein [Anaerolineae bacterium]
MAQVNAGSLLYVDLTEQKSWAEPIQVALLEKYLLGSGLAAHLFMEDGARDADPLAPESPLYVFNGLLTGTFAPAACRTSICGRSPLTSIWNEANMGGHWGAELRFAGYDGLVIRGRASEPAYLWVDGRQGTVEIRPAGHLWGKDTFETAIALYGETDAKAQVLSIGQAGENLVRIAGVTSCGPEHTRLAGRGGMGAAWGSKNLKAIVVRGEQKPSYFDPERFRAAVREANAWIKANSLALSKLGTAGGVPGAEKVGDLPIQNWRLGNWAGAEKVSGQRLAETIFAKHTHCFACPIGCGKAVEVREGPYVGVQGHGPEYETVAGFGGNLLIDDLGAVAKLNDLCNRFGLDTISTSGAIAFAMEAWERGLIGPADTEGLELTWGNAEAAVGLVEQIAHRQGLGDLLADGVCRAAQRLGPEAEAFAIHVKGLELPYHDPRGFVDMGLNYATANRGACHLESLSYWPGYGVVVPQVDTEGPYNRHNSRGKERVVFDHQNYVSVFNPLGLCKFIIKGLVGPDVIARILCLAMGWDWSSLDLLRTGERLFTLKRQINVGFGVSRADDTLPRRMLTEPRPTGGSAGVLPRLDEMLEGYYRLRGWDAQGRPTAETLKRLGLDG